MERKFNMRIDVTMEILVYSKVNDIKDNDELRRD